MCSWIWQNFNKFSLKCGTVFCLCRTFWERVKVQVMEGSHVRKKYFGHWLINPYPPLTALLSKGSLFRDLATCRDLHWVVEIPLWCLIYMLEIRYERRCEPLHMKYGSLSAPKAFFYPKMATNECNSKLNPDFLITLAQIGRYCFV